MGKRKKNTQNVVNIDLGDYAFEDGRVLPVLVQHSSKDGRRIEQTIHRIPAPGPSLPPAFDPRPVVEEAEEDAPFFDFEPPGGGDGGDRVCSCFSLLFSVPNIPLCCSQIRSGYGAQNATLSFKTLCGWKGVWNSVTECATFA